MKHKIICGHVIPVLKSLPDEYVDMLMTSVPYWGLRDYGEDTATIWGGSDDCEHEWKNLLQGHHPGQVAQTKNQIASGSKNSGKFCSKCSAWHGQLGLEPTPELYIEHLRMVFAEVKRVLKKTGTCWVNIGDSYSNSGECGNPRWKSKEVAYRPACNLKSLPPKCMVGIPERFMFMMIDLGYILRNKIIWHKQNSMPSSVKDRFNTTYEVVYFFVKNNKPVYWYNDKTGVMVDRKPTTQIKGVDWDLKEAIDVNSHEESANTGFFNKEPYKGNNPHRERLGKTGEKKLKKLSHWHSLDYWFDLCLSEDTEVYIKEGNIVKPTTLLELFNSPIKGKDILSPYGWRRLLGIRESEIESISKITAGHLGTIISSEAHRFPVSQRSHGFMVKSAKDINEKHDRDYLLYVPLKNYLSPSIFNLDLRELGCKEWDSFAFVKRRRASQIPIKLELDYGLGYFLGAYLAEGNIVNMWKVEFSLRKNELLVEHIKTFLNSFKVHLTVSDEKGRNGVTAVFSNPVFVKVVKYLTVGTNSYDKGVNREVILNTSFKFREGILNGFMCGDGTENRGALVSQIASKRLRDDICLIASSLGYEFSKFEDRVEYNGEDRFYNGVRVFVNGKYKSRGRKLKEVNKETFGKGSNLYNSKQVKPFNAFFIGSKIEQSDERLRFFDLEVKDDLFLLNGGIVTHNSAVRERHKWVDKNGKRIGSNTIGQGTKLTKHELATNRLKGSYTDPLHTKPLNPSGKNPGDVIEMNKEEWLEYCTYLWDLSQEYPDFFNINTQPYSGAHFAVFPEKLVEKPLLSGCPAEVCSKCGKARVRITNRSGEVNQQWGERKSKPWFDDKREMPQKVIKEGIYETIGWTDCKCGKNPNSCFFCGYKEEHGNLKTKNGIYVCDECLLQGRGIENKYQPGIILDPFGGSGTVSVEAEKLGRSSIYIDIKKNYCEMAVKRLKPLVEQTKLSGERSKIEREGF